ERLYGTFSGELRPTSGVPTQSELGTLLFLGTYPATAAITFPQSNDHERFAHHNLFVLTDRQSRSAATKPIPAEMRRLFAGWLAERTDPVPVGFGMHLAFFHGIREALPAARAAAARELPPEAKGFALLAVGQLGSKRDLPLLEKAFNDQRLFHAG